uniref:F-box domain-containing protein n=1 Tax=Oryza punctata TaxID=4537 RepID=A0A0E0JZ27_ORYPU
MADTNMAYAELPDRCHVSILSHLPFLLDHAMLSSVCKPWRCNDRWACPPPMLLWLLMLFCVACEHTHPPTAAPAYRTTPAALACADDIPGQDWWPRLSWGSWPRSLRDNDPFVTDIDLILAAAPSHVHPNCAAAIVSGKPNITFWPHA